MNIYDQEYIDMYRERATETSRLNRPVSMLYNCREALKPVYTYVGKTHTTEVYQISVMLYEFTLNAKEILEAIKYPSKYYDLLEARNLP